MTRTQEGRSEERVCRPAHAPGLPSLRTAARLPAAFYERETTTVARELLGRILVRRLEGELLAGVIVETEAYGPDDPASHAWRGETRRNAVMFGPPGRLYVYLTYGMHWCMNAVTGPPGIGEAVLIRALEPLAGLEAMRRNRGGVPDRLLCSGPARACQALGITGAENGADLAGDAVYILEERVPVERVAAGPRIGIRHAVERPWRFHIPGSPHVSRR